MAEDIMVEQEQDMGLTIKGTPRKRKPKTKNVLQYTSKIPPGRSTTQHIPSIDLGSHVAAAVPKKVYTGTKIIGIGTLHKSNAVPIFSDEEAKDIAKMRR